MKIYLAVGGGKRVHDFAEHRDLGWLMTPFNCRTPPRNLPYVADNGKFRVFSEGLKGNKIEWKEKIFLNFLKRYPNYDFVVVPDIVCPKNPWDSLNLSLQWVERLEHPRYLAVQDGMWANQVTEYIDCFDGLFVGGSLSWKFQTAQMWADLAHLYKKKCHAGRVGTWEGLGYMETCGVDSVDSSTASRNNKFSNLLKYFEQSKLEWF